jgi:hypothetical protein
MPEALEQHEVATWLEEGEAFVQPSECRTTLAGADPIGGKNTNLKLRMYHRAFRTQI